MPYAVAACLHVHEHIDASGPAHASSRGVVSTECKRRDGNGDHSGASPAGAGDVAVEMAVAAAIEGRLIERHRTREDYLKDNEDAIALASIEETEEEDEEEAATELAVVLANTEAP